MLDLASSQNEEIKKKYQVISKNLLMAELTNSSLDIILHTGMRDSDSRLVQMEDSQNMNRLQIWKLSRKSQKKSINTITRNEKLLNYFSILTLGIILI